MLSVFRKVLDRGLAEPSIAIASLPLSADDDYSALDELGLIHIDRTDYPRESSLIDVFRQQVAAYPAKVAVKDSSTQLSYAQLDQRSDLLAQWLARRSFAAETLIGVFAPRSCHTIIAFLGILKANLAYLPLDVKTPVARMEAILSSLQGHRLVLVGSDVQPPAVQLGEVEFIRIADTLDEEAQSNNGFHGLGAAASPSATSLAYVMFTSGSTGQPKGVMVEHRSILRLARQCNMVQYLPPAATMAHMANVAFDASSWEIYATLLNGGTLICVDSMVMLDASALAAILSRENVQAVLVTPALLKQYLVECPATLSMLHTLYVGGDRAQPQMLVSARKLIKGEVLNAYGPTENTVASAIYCFPDGEACTNGVPIGRALSNSGAYVMDPHQRLVPLGVVGELVVTGDGLARGYTDPRQNVDRFVSVTIGGEKVRAYRTGDFVRYRPVDGQLEFFGRMDGQIKIRGQRVELGEIEHVLRSHDCVDDAVAVLRREDGQEAQIVSFVTVREDVAEPDEQPDSGQELQHVEVWEERFDAETYTPIDSMRTGAIGRDFIGWTSMYDGSDIDKGEMNEWLDDTIETILNGPPPRACSRDRNRLRDDPLQPHRGTPKLLESIPVLADKVKMYKATATDVGRLCMPISPSLVVLNSVVQYFPSLDYN
ncbi:hypothetical protein HIM_12080 [Hirsutella minnesotensis 3608]|uniref:AMP-dependent synthetase/ligase domain-containing protein n=1 Tax=Hirsutella minnesotensis 3608 TaxID=1043627 RepID=A0A0F7ZW85_9HYPO|nr:hypothetical protein HIM_12080 [Hirsutella minnesotensis 3608]